MHKIPYMFVGRKYQKTWTRFLLLLLYFILQEVRSGTMIVWPHDLMVSSCPYVLVNLRHCNLMTLRPRYLATSEPRGRMALWSHNPHDPVASFPPDVVTTWPCQLIASRPQALLSHDLGPKPCDPWPCDPMTLWPCNLEASWPSDNIL
jgi:hypothetical protein